MGEIGNSNFLNGMMKKEYNSMMKRKYMLLSNALSNIIKHTEDSVDYNKLLNDIRQLSDAEYVMLNVRNLTDNRFYLMDMLIEESHLNRALNKYAFNPIGRSWLDCQIENEAYKGLQVIYVSTLSELIGESGIKEIVVALERELHFQQIVVIRGIINKQVMCDFILLMHHTLSKQEEEMLVTYADAAATLFRKSYVQQDVENKKKNYTLAITEDFFGQSNEINPVMQRYENVLEGMNAGVWEWNIATGEKIINEHSAHILGYRLEEISPLDFETFSRYCHPEDLVMLREKLQQVFTHEEQLLNAECRLWHKEQRWVWVNIRGKVLKWSEDGQPLLMVGTHFDITERIEREQRLKESEQLNRLIMSQMKQGLAVHEIICDAAGKPIDYKYLVVNPSFGEQIGMELDDIVGKTVLQILPETETYWIEVFGHVALTGESMQFEQYSASLNKWFSVTAYSPKPMQFASLATDITDLKQANEEITKKNEIINRFFSISLDLFCILNMDGQFIQVNDACKEMFGNQLKVLQQKALQDYIHVDDIEEALIVQKRLNNQEKIFDYVIRMRRYDGMYRHLEWRFHPFGNSIYAAARDITERLEREQEVQYLSIHDHMTGLYNRRFMDQQLHTLAQQKNLPFTLFALDINGLKYANDTFGHEMGDALIQTVADILKMSARPSDIVCRIGGDEFVILSPKMLNDEARVLKFNIIHRVQQAKLEPVVVSVAIGYAVMTNADQSIADLLREADEKMYRNKQKYKDKSLFGG